MRDKPQSQHQPPPGYVPIQAMDARLARQEERFGELQRQNAALLAAMQNFRQPQKPPEPPAPPPDFFDNPDAAFEYRFKPEIQRLREEMQGIREEELRADGGREIRR